MFGKKDKLEIYMVSDFISLSGETTSFGKSSLFLRAAGCPCTCRYCDTAHSQKITKDTPKKDLYKLIDKYLTKYIGVENIVLTGGDPLMQLKTEDLILLSRYVYKKYPNVKIQIETNGAIPIIFSDIYEDNITFIIDYKLAGSGEEKKMVPSNYVLARPQDEIKFVVTDLKEWKTIIKVIEKYKIKCNNIWVSPVNDPNDKDFTLGKKLWNKVATAGIPSLRMQVQLHKVVFPNATKEV